MNIHSRFASLGGGGKGGGDRRSPVGGHRIITGLVPCDGDPRRDPHRSSRSLPGDAHRERRTRCTRCPTASACARRWRRSTASWSSTSRSPRPRAARDYVLPAASQYEKWEATFFTLEFPRERVPAAAADPRAAARARCPSRRSTLAWRGRSVPTPTTTSRRCTLPRPRGVPRTPTRSSTRWSSSPQLAPLAPIVLYETLGPTLGLRAAKARPRYGDSRRRAS